MHIGEKMKTYMNISVVILALWSVTNAYAEDQIQTDRPDFVESSNTVGKGRFQIETSVAYESDKNSDARSRTFSTPTLLRLGLADDWEFRFETDGRLSQRVEDLSTHQTDHANGYADFALGFKWHQDDGDEKTMAPSTAWLFHLDMPAGSKAFLSHQVRPSLRYVAEWELANDYSMGVMPGLIYEVNDTGDRYWAGIFGLVVGKSFSDKFRGFVEFGGQSITSRRNGGSQLTFDIGVAYLLNDLVQLDLLYNRGLNQYTPDDNIGLGLSVKY
jgi:Putative MetA-pathway of phenol degradation